MIDARASSATDLPAAIYGQVLASSEVAALSLDESLDSAAILAAMSATVLVFWLAHVYARTVAERAEGRAPSRGAITAVMRFEWPIVQAAAPAAVALTLGIAGIVSTHTAVVLAICLGAANLFGWGIAIGRRASLGTGPTLVVAIANALFGLGVILLKVAIH